MKSGGGIASIAVAAVLAAGATSAIAQRRLLATENIPSVRKNGAFARDFISPDETCGTKRGFNVEIETMPTNGTVALAKTSRPLTHDDASGFTFLVTPPGDAAAVRNCIGRTVPVIRMTYRPQADYSGFDQIGYVVTWTDGQKRSATIYMRIY